MEDFTGCQQSINVNRPWARDIIIGALKHICYNLQFDGVRIDQAALFGRVSEQLKFDRGHVFFRELDLPGKIILNEPNDGDQTPAGQFPKGHYEHNFDHRTHWLSFFSGKACDLHAVSKLVSGSHNLYKIPDTSKPSESIIRGVSVADCHDGKTLWDQTHDVVEEMMQQRRARRGLPVEELRVRLARAIEASVIFSPGAFTTTMGTEILRSQQGNSNAYTSPDLLRRNWHFADSDFGDARSGFFDFMAECTRLRRALHVFHHDRHYNPNQLIFWFNNRGQRMASDEWQAAKAPFLGTIYAERAGKDGTRETVYVARLGAAGKFELPKVTNGYYWALLIDTTRAHPFGKERAVTEGQYEVAMPGVVVCKLARAH